MKWLVPDDIVSILIKFYGTDDCVHLLEPAEQDKDSCHLRIGLDAVLNGSV